MGEHDQRERFSLAASCKRIPNAVSSSEYIETVLQLQNVQLVPLILWIGGIIVYILQKIALPSSFDFNSFN
ncbi:MAG: hypothetical protein LKJ90_09455 [Faecalibacterium sp.]|jgi:hypothetical protein|nr:hypothetical protein [Faecalibacterium sp.]